MIKRCTWIKRRERECSNSGSFSEIGGRRLMTDEKYFFMHKYFFMQYIAHWEDVLI